MGSFFFFFCHGKGMVAITHEIQHHAKDPGIQHQAMPSKWLKMAAAVHFKMAAQEVIGR